MPNTNSNPYTRVTVTLLPSDASPANPGSPIPPRLVPNPEPVAAFIDYPYAVRQVKLAEIAACAIGDYLVEAIMLTGVEYNLEATQRAVEAIRGDLLKLADKLHRLDMAQPFVD